MLATVMLYEDGDIKRAYSYLNKALDDANFCKARLKVDALAPLISIVNESYIEAKKKDLKILYVCMGMLCFLLLQLILMKRNPINIVFDVVIPISAAFTFGCYAITMAMDRPVILICPPTVYFVSLLTTSLVCFLFLLHRFDELFWSAVF